MRAWLYHWEEPKGKIFTDQGEYDRALADGWVEAPWLAVKPEDVVAVIATPPLTEITEAGAVLPIAKKKGSRWPVDYVPKGKVKKSGNKPKRK